MTEFIDLEVFKKVKEYVKYFADLKSMPKGCVTEADYVRLLMAGYDLGLSISQSEAGLAYTAGKITVYGTVAAMLMKRAGYDWKTIESNSKKCLIKIRDTKHKEKEPEEIPYTMEEAEHAGINKSIPWQKYPKKMLYWKCLSWARNTYCPDAINGMAIYEDYQEVDTPTEKDTEGWDKGFAIDDVVSPQEKQEEIEVENNKNLDEIEKTLETNKEAEELKDKNLKDKIQKLKGVRLKK